MVVGPDGVVAGTVGGGCGEGEVLEVAQEVLADGLPRMVRVDLTEDLLSLSPAVCGGILEIWVERVESTEFEAPDPSWDEPLIEPPA